MMSVVVHEVVGGNVPAASGQERGKSGSNDLGTPAAGTFRFWRRCGVAGAGDGIAIRVSWATSVKEPAAE